MEKVIAEMVWCPPCGEEAKKGVEPRGAKGSIGIEIEFASAWEWPGKRPRGYGKGREGQGRRVGEGSWMGGNGELGFRRTMCDDLNILYC